MAADPSPSELLAGCVSAVTTGGTHGLSEPLRRTDAVETTRHDVKLRLDVECQIEIEKLLARMFPSHKVLGEEDTGAVHGQSSDYEWIVDPIDGTVNFSHSLPQWCCSVAVRRGGVMLAGAVYAPELGELYTAAEGLPARMNSRILHVSGVTALDRSMIFTGLQRHAGTSDFGLLQRIADTVQKVRIMGAAALDSYRVASGHGEGYSERGVHIWDTAAAGLIVERAGGRSEVLGMKARTPFLATNGHIHEALSRVIL